MLGGSGFRGPDLLKRRRFLLLFACFVVLLAGGAYVTLVYTGASRSIVETVLGRFIRGRFGLDDAEVDPTTGTVRLEGVRIGHPHDEQSDILVARHVLLDVNTNPLGGEEMGKVRRVEVRDLHLRLSLTESEQWNLLDVLDLPEASSAHGGFYPAVIITDSTVTVQISADRPAVDFTSVHVEMLPDQEGSPRVTLTGSLMTPAGFAVRMHGTGDLDTGEMRAQFDVEDLPLLPATAHPYSPAAAAYLAESKLSGVARAVTLSVQYPPAPMDEAFVSAQLSADVEGVDWTFREFPYPIAGAAGRILASTAAGGSIHFELLAKQDEKSILTRGQLTHCLSGAPLVDVLVKALGIPVDDALAHALDALPESRAARAAFAPVHGTADGEVFLRNDHPGGALRVSMDLEPHGVSATFVGFPGDGSTPPIAFPYAIQNVEGLIQLRPDKIAIRGLVGSRPDGGQLHLDGELSAFDADGPTEVSLEIGGEGVAFSDELRAALGTLLPGGEAIYDSYAPIGATEVHVSIGKHPGADLDYSVEMRPNRASASYGSFPYRLRDLRGRIRISPAGVAFDLSGTKDRSEVELGGRFLLRDVDEGLDSELWLHGRDVRLDEELHRAMVFLNPASEWVWRELDPVGTVDCNVTMWAQAGAPGYRHDVRLDFHEGSAQLPWLGRRIEDLHGTVFVSGSDAATHMDLNLLRGTIGNGAHASPAEIVLEGGVDARDTSVGFDLTAIVRGLELNDELAATLEQAEIASRSLWSVLRPSGMVDLVARHRKAVGEPDIAHDLRVQLRGVRSDAAMLPRPVTGLEGELRLVGERADFGEIRGRLGAAPLVCRSGFIEHADGRTLVDVRLGAERLPLDQQFANLMTGPLRDAYIQRNMRGTIDFSDLHVVYTFPDEGSGFDLAFEGPVTAHNLGMVLATPVEEINGVFDFVDGHVTPRGGTVSCTADRVSFRVLGHGVTDFHGRFSADPDGITLHDLAMGMHGGHVRAAGPDDLALRFDWESEELATHVRWDEMRLTDFIRASGQPSPISRGTMSGELDLKLPLQHVVDMEARGNLQIRNGRLGEVPIFTSIYAFLSPSKRPQFDGGQVALRVANQSVTIDNLVLTSPLVEVKGKGTIGLDGYLDIVLEFPDFFASAGDWLVLPQVVRAISTQVVRFHLYGYLRSPHARPRWLFQDTPDRRHIEPIPARIPAPPHRRF